MIAKDNVRLMITLSKDLLKYIDSRCNETGLSRSFYLKLLLIVDKEKHES